MKICIDPGHGGNDTGAPGPSGLNESEVVLDLSLLVEEILKHAGMSVRLTRTTDCYPELSERCDIANEWEADYFVSIHCNCNGPSTTGIETLYSSENGKKLATPIQAEMLAATGDTDRGLKHRTDLYVLNGTSMPAALAEVGFISNPNIEAKMRQDDWKHSMASAIANGICKHVGMPTEELPPPSQTPPLAEKTVTCPKCGEQFKVTVS